MYPAHDGDYETVAAGQTDQILGATGSKDDWLERLIISVATAATSQVDIKDGNGAAINIVPPNTPIGVYEVMVQAKALATTTPGWKVTTAAGVSVLAIGSFT